MTPIETDLLKVVHALVGHDTYFNRILRRLTNIEEQMNDIAADVMILRDVVEDL